MFVSDRDIHFLSKYQANALLDNIKDFRHKTLILLMLDAGLRVSEAISLKFSNFDFKKKILFVTSLKKRGTNKVRQIPLSNRLFECLANYIKEFKVINADYFVFPSPLDPNKHVCRSSVNKYLTRIQKKINADKVHPHALRHTCATSMVATGTNLHEIADILGHEDINVTRIYTHIPSQILRNSIQKASDYNSKTKFFSKFFKKKETAVYIPVSNSIVIGRALELQEITDHIEKGTNVCLIGAVGTGKRTILNNLKTTKKILTLDDTSGIKKSLLYLLLYLYKNEKETVAALLFSDFDLDKIETKLSRQSVGFLCDKIIEIVQPKEFILKINSVNSITNSSISVIEKLKDHFVIITSAFEIPINKESFLWNFEKIKIKNLSRTHSLELIHKLSYDMEIEDYELYKNHIWEQTNGNPRAVVEMVERYRREPILINETVRSVTHRGSIRDLDFSFVVIFFIAGLAIFRYMTSEFDNPGLRVIGGMSMILLLLSRSMFSFAKRRYV